jgi:hypothetical protein
MVRKPAAGFMERASAGEDRDTVPTALTVPHRLVPGLRERLLGEVFPRRLHFLQPDNIRLG